MAEDVLEIVLATRNRHKLLEFKRLLTRLRVRWLRLTDLRIDAEVAENGKRRVQGARILPPQRSPYTCG